MTVCIGAICNNGEAAIVASDRMVTGHYPPIEFEHTKPKIFDLTKSCVVLTAGSALKPIELINRTKQALDEIGKPQTVEQIVETMGSLYQMLRAREAEEVILKPRTMSKELFYQKGVNILPSDLFNVIDNQFTRYDYGIQVLVVGIDAQAHIRSILNPGLVNCYDTLGFHAIGVGYLHAIQVFIGHRYDTSFSMEEAMNIVYSAKKAAEVAPGVGNETDISVILPDRIGHIDPKIIKELSKIYQEVRKSPVEVIKESSSRLASLIAERTKGKGEKNEDKKERNKNDN